MTIITADGMFANGDILDIDTTTPMDFSGLTSAAQMFQNATTPASIDFLGIDWSNVTNLDQAFAGCTTLKTLDLSDLPTYTGEDSNIFTGCEGLVCKVTVANWLVFSAHGYTTDEVTFDVVDFYTFTETTGYANLQVSINSTAWSALCDGTVVLEELPPITSPDSTKTLSLSYLLEDYPLDIKVDNVISNNMVSDISYMFKGWTDRVIDLSALDSGIMPYINFAGIFDNCTGLDVYFSTCETYIALDSLNYDVDDVQMYIYDFYSDSGAINSTFSSNVKNNYFSESRMPAFEANTVNAISTFAYYSSITKLDLTRWNTTGFTSFYGLFLFCSKLVEIVGLGDLDASSVTSLEYTFKDNDVNTSVGAVSNWNITSSLTNCNYLFYDITAPNVDLDLSSWDTSGLTEGSDLFYSAEFNSVNISGWYLCELDRVFSYAKINNLYMNNVTLKKFTSSSSGTNHYNFSYMYTCENLYINGFSYTPSTISPYLTRLFTSCPATHIYADDWTGFILPAAIFSGCLAETISFKNFGGDYVYSLSSNFSDCPNLTTLDISGYPFSSITTLTNVFENCPLLTGCGVTSFECGALTNITSLFSGCTSWSDDITITGTSTITSASEAFYNCSAPKIDLSGLTFSASATCTDMLVGCDGLEELYLPNSITADATTYVPSELTKTYVEVGINNYVDWDALYPYSDYGQYTNFAASDFYDRYMSGQAYTGQFGISDAGKTMMTGSFVLPLMTKSFLELLTEISPYKILDSSSVVTALDFSRWEDTPIDNAATLFSGCTTVVSINFGQFDFTNVSSWYYMFSNCTSLTTLTNFYPEPVEVTNLDCAFRNCSSLKTLDLSGFGAVNIDIHWYTFTGCDGLICTVGIDDLATFLDMGHDPSEVTFVPIGIYDITIDENDPDLSIVSLSEGAHEFLEEYDGDEWSLPVPEVTTSKVSLEGFFDETARVIDVSALSSLNIVNYNRMFASHSDLTLDLSDFDFTDATVEEMFTGTNISVTVSDVMDYMVLDTVDLSVEDYELILDGFYSVSYGIVSLPDEATELIEGGYFDGLRLPNIPESGASISGLFQLIDVSTINVSRFKTSNISSMISTFASTELDEIIGLEYFDTSNVTSFQSLFNGSQLSYMDTSSMANWDTSSVTNMSYLFNSTRITDSSGLANWDTSNVTNMSYIFANSRFTEVAGIENWNVNSVTNLSYAFYTARITSLDLSNWTLASVTNMGYAFRSSSNYALTSLSLPNINGDSGVSLSSMCFGNTALTTITFPEDLTCVTSLSYAFYECTELTNVNGSVNAYYCTNISYMFSGCYNIRPDISDWVLDTCTAFNYAFSECAAMLEVTFPALTDDWRTRTFTGCFYSCTMLTTVDLSQAYISGQTGAMFQYCSSLELVKMQDCTWSSSYTNISTGVSGARLIVGTDYYENINTGHTNYDEFTIEAEDFWELTAIPDTSYATVSLSAEGAAYLQTTTLSGGRVPALPDSDFTGFDISSLFDGFTTLSTIDFVRWGDASIISMAGTFKNCQALTSINLGSLTFDSLTDLSEAFYDCTSLISLPFTDPSATANVTDFSSVCINCTSLTSAELDFSSCETLALAFNYCSALETLDCTTLPSGYTDDDATYIFTGCNGLVCDVGVNNYVYFVLLGYDPDVVTFGAYDAYTTTVLEDTAVAASAMSLSPTTLSLSSVATTQTESGTTLVGLSDQGAAIVSAGLWENLPFPDFPPITTENVSLEEMFVGVTVTNVDMSMVNVTGISNITKMFMGCGYVYFTPGSGMVFTDDMSGTSALDYTSYPTVVTSNPAQYRAFDQIGMLKHVRIEYNPFWTVTDGTVSITNTVSDLVNYDGYRLPPLPYDTSISSLEEVFANSTVSFIDTERMDTSSVLSLKKAFYNSAITKVSLNNWDMQEVITLESMFELTPNIVLINLSSSTINNVAYMDCTFKDSGVQEILFSSFTGITGCTSFSETFSGCSALTTITGIGTISITHAWNLYRMFYGCSALESLDLTSYDFSGCTNAIEMFAGAGGTFYFDDLSSLYNSKITNFAYGATGTVHCKPGSFWLFDYWDQDASTDMDVYCTEFYEFTTLSTGEDQIALTEEANRVLNTDCYNGYRLPGFEEGTSDSLSYSYMFYDLTTCTYLDLELVDMARGADLSYLFYLSGNLANVLNMTVSDEPLTIDYLVCNNTALENIEILNDFKVASWIYAFSGAAALDFDVSKITEINTSSWKGVFRASGLTSFDLSETTTVAISSLEETFKNCTLIEEIDLSGITYNETVNFLSTFNGCSSLANLTLPTQEVKTGSTLYGTFNSCSSLTSLDLTNFDVSAVVSTSRMFCDCSSLTSLNLEGWTPAEDVNISYMFSNNTSLKYVDLAYFYIQDTDPTNVFDNCDGLYIYTYIGCCPKYVELGYDYTVVDFDVWGMVDIREEWIDDDGSYGWYTSLTDIGKEVIEAQTFYGRPTPPPPVAPEGYYPRWTSLFEESIATYFDLSRWDTSQVEATISMFLNSSIETIIWPDQDLFPVCNSCSKMFKNTPLTEIDLSRWAINNSQHGTSVFELFCDCTQLDNVILGDGVDWSAVTGYTGVFYNTSADMDLSKFTVQNNVVDYNLLGSGTYTVDPENYRFWSQSTNPRLQIPGFYTEVETDGVVTVTLSSYGRTVISGGYLYDKPLPALESDCVTANFSGTFASTAIQCGDLNHNTPLTSVTSYQSTFYNCTSLTSITSLVAPASGASASYMCYNCYNLTTFSLGTFNVTNLDYTFANNRNLTNCTLSSTATSAISAFNGAGNNLVITLNSALTVDGIFAYSSATSLYLAAAAATSAESAFFECYNLVAPQIYFNQVGIHCYYMFGNCDSLTNVTGNTLYPGNAECLFNGATSLTAIPSTINWSYATSLFGAFQYDSALLTADLSTVTNNCTNMGYCFYGATALTTFTATVTGTNLTSLQSMFNQCYALTSFSWDALQGNTSLNANYMFYLAGATTISLPGLLYLGNADQMFYNNYLTTAQKTLVNLSSLISITGGNPFSGVKITELLLFSYGTPSAALLTYASVTDLRIPISQYYQYSTCKLATSCTITNILPNGTYTFSTSGSTTTCSLTTAAKTHYDTYCDYGAIIPIPDPYKCEYGTTLTSDYISFAYLFYQRLLKYADLSKIPTANLINVSYMFAESGLNTTPSFTYFTNITDASYCLSNTDITSLTLYATDMPSADLSSFARSCSSLTSANITRGTQTTDIKYFVAYCTALTSVSLTATNVDNISLVGFCRSSGSTVNTVTVNIDSARGSYLTHFNVSNSSSVVNMTIGDATGADFSYAFCSAGAKSVTLNITDGASTTFNSAFYANVSLTSVAITMGNSASASMWNCFYTTKVSGSVTLSLGTCNNTYIACCASSSYLITPEFSMILGNGSPTALTSSSFSGLQAETVRFTLGEGTYGFSSGLYGNTYLKNIYLTMTGSQNASNFSYLCYNCTNLEYAYHNASSGVNFTTCNYGYTFFGCESLDTPLIGLGNSTNTSYQYMFSGCEGMTNAAGITFGTATGASIVGLFQNCTALTTFASSNNLVVSDVSYVFYGVPNATLSKLFNLVYANMYELTSMYCTFYGSNITMFDLDTYGSNFPYLANLSYVCQNCDYLTKISLPYLPSLGSMYSSFSARETTVNPDSLHILDCRNWNQSVLTSSTFANRDMTVLVDETMITATYAYSFSSAIKYDSEETTRMVAFVDPDYSNSYAWYNANYSSGGYSKVIMSGFLAYALRYGGYRWMPVPDFLDWLDHGYSSTMLSFSQGSITFRGDIDISELGTSFAAIDNWQYAFYSTVIEEGDVVFPTFSTPSGADITFMFSNLETAGTFDISNVTFTNPTSARRTFSDILCTGETGFVGYENVFASMTWSSSYDLNFTFYCAQFNSSDDFEISFPGSTYDCTNYTYAFCNIAHHNIVVGGAFIIDSTADLTCMFYRNDVSTVDSSLTFTINFDLNSGIGHVLGDNIITDAMFNGMTHLKFGAHSSSDYKLFSNASGGSAVKANVSSLTTAAFYVSTSYFYDRDREEMITNGWTAFNSYANL